jgi:erythronate-4-phosphate dehydrogenase
MKVLLNDPPRERVEGKGAFVSIEQIMEQADIISLHVPLNMKGQDITFHLADDAFFEQLTKKPVLINTCRGEVVKTEAVKKALRQGQIKDFVCDCWENEPDIDLELLAMTALATPHIAGYSKDGKALGTQMSVQAVSRFFGLGLDQWKPLSIEPPQHPIIELDGFGLSQQKILSKAVLATYDIREDDRTFRANTSLFEQLRGDYPVRREFPAYTIKPRNIDIDIVEKLKQLGFTIQQ